METHKQAAKRGKKSRASGAVFEKRVRADLEEKGWIVDRFTNNVEFNGLKVPGKNEIFNQGRLIPAKPKFVFNPVMKRRIMIGNNSGFPDFIAFKRVRFKIDKTTTTYNWLRSIIKYCEKRDVVEGEMYSHPEFCRVIGVEAKSNGILTKLEKEKCQWYLDNNIFSKILIAVKTKPKNRIVIEYRDFEEKYGKKTQKQTQK